MTKAAATMKVNTLILETVIIMAGLIIAGCIAAVVFRPESSTPIIVLVTTLTGLGVSTILQLRGVKANAAKIDRVEQNTNGTNTQLLSSLAVLLDHATGKAPLNTGQLDVVRASMEQARQTIDARKGIGQ